MMKKLLLLLVVLCSTLFSAFAQEDESRKLVNEFISKFNDQKFEEIYDSFAPSFKQQIPKASGEGLLTQVFSIAGKLEIWKLISTDAGRYNYLLKGTKNNVAFSFNITDHLLDKLRISPGDPNEAPPAMAPMVKTNNPGKSDFDRFIDDKIKSFQVNNRITGLAAGLLNGDKMLFYGYGETVKGNKIIPAKNALFDIGSISKTFTAYILASLVTEKKIALTATLDQYFKGLDKQVGGITIVQLANHTSGLPNMGAIPTNGDEGRDPNEKYTTKDLEDGLMKVTLTGAPGAKFGYSNLGFATLGYILEKASGKSYQQLLDKYIMKPAKLTNTFYQAPANYPVYTKGYAPGGAVADYLKLAAYGPAGNIKSTTEDLLKYAQFLMERNKAAELTRTITFTPEKGNKMGLSWIVIPMDNKEFYFHNGATLGYRSYIAIEPATKKAFVMLNNSAVDVTNLGMQIMPGVLKM